MTDVVSEARASDIIVYLVDDDRGMVSATSQWLSLSGLKIQAFADPMALMKVVKAGTKCVVVSDIRMPGISGMELMKLIKARDSRIPVVLITGHGDIQLAVEAMKVGAFEFLPKPFEPEKLLETVQNAQNELLSAHSKLNDVELVGTVVDQSKDVGPNEDGLSERVAAFEKEIIESALKRHKGSIPSILEELAIPRRTLNAKMSKYGIHRSSFR